jgi:hypothetical protein
MGEVYDTLNNYWMVAITLAIGCASFLLSREVLLRELMAGPVHAITVVAALGTTLFMFVLYMHATREELELAKTHRYIELVGQPQAEAVILIACLALCFGGLIAFTTNLLVYGELMIVLQIADIFGAYIARRRFQNLESKKHVNIPGRAILHEYYVTKPHLRMRVLRLAGCVVAVFLAVKARKNQLTIVTEFGWAIMIFSILGAEFVLHRWRQLRRYRLTSIHP